MAHGRAHCRPSSLPPQFICPCVIEQPIASTRRVLRVADAPATQRRRCQRSRETSPMLARAARWLTSRLERLPTSERWAASTWEQAGDRLAVSMWRTRRQRRQTCAAGFEDGQQPGWLIPPSEGPLKFLPPPPTGQLSYTRALGRASCCAASAYRIRRGGGGGDDGGGARRHAGTNTNNNLSARHDGGLQRQPACL